MTDEQAALLAAAQVFGSTKDEVFIHMPFNQLVEEFYGWLQSKKIAAQPLYIVVDPPEEPAKPVPTPPRKSQPAKKQQGKRVTRGKL